MNSISKKGVLWVLAGASMWATLPVFSRFSYAHGSDSITSAAMRAYLACLVFICWFLADGTFKKVKIKDLPFYICYGLFGVGGTFLFYMMAVERISTAMAAMLLYTAPAFVILFSRLFYKEPITRTKVIALVCTFGGCALVVRFYDLASLSGNVVGLLIGLASGICYSMTTVMGRIALKKNDSRTNAGLMILCGSLIFLVLRPPWTIEVPHAALWVDWAGLALLGSVGAYLAYLKGLGTGLDGGVAGITATVEPVIATLLGVVIMGDILEIWQVLGMAVVLLGVAFPWIRNKRGRNAEPAALEMEEEPGLK